MRTRPFGTNGPQIPVVGLGTWKMERDERSAAIAAIRAAVEAGAGHIDTAEMYGNGEVERIVGDALEGCRHDAFLVSKVLPHNASRRGTIEACEASLKRLRTDHLDAYLLHWSGSHPLEETIAAFDELRRDGKIRAWGVSNFDDDELDDARRIAGDEAIACNQVLYHTEERAIEHALIPWCRRHDVAVVAYSPFGSGRFPPPSSDGGRALASIGEEHGATPRQVALAFLLREPGTFVIPKTSSVAHLHENLGAAELRLSEEEVAKLDDVFPRGSPGRGLPMI